MCQSPTYFWKTCIHSQLGVLAFLPVIADSHLCLTNINMSLRDGHYIIEMCLGACEEDDRMDKPDIEAEISSTLTLWWLYQIVIKIAGGGCFDTAGFLFYIVKTFLYRPALLHNVPFNCSCTLLTSKNVEFYSDLIMWMSWAKLDQGPSLKNYWLHT